MYDDASRNLSEDRDFEARYEIISVYCFCDICEYSTWSNHPVKMGVPLESIVGHKCGICKTPMNKMVGDSIDWE